MTELAKKKCIPCEGNIPPFNTEEIHKYLKKINGWQVIEDKIDGFHLIKNFKFDDFLQSQEFINKVGEIAEAEGHHESADEQMSGVACQPAPMTRTIATVEARPFRVRFGCRQHACKAVA